MSFRNLVAVSALAVSAPALGGEAFHVDPSGGNSNFNAIFDAKLGERINAVSSEVGCDVTFDEKANTFSGTCAVPLTSIKVDSNETKSEHFQSWATNNKGDAKACKLEARFENVKLDAALAPEKASSFTTEVPFTVCGRAREDNGKEKVTGMVMLLPASGAGAKTLKVRATLSGFNRERYHIGPKWTDGWAARVQSLASVVSPEGTIDLSLFAKSQEPAKAAPMKPEPAKSKKG